MDRDREPPPNSAPAPEAQTERGPSSPAEAFRESFGEGRELREYIAYYVSAKIDRWKLAFHRFWLLTLFGAVALLAGAAIAVTGAVLLCVGLAQAVTMALGGRAWAGNLIVGGAVLLSIAVGGWLAFCIINERSRQATVKKYERRKTGQRADFGHDVRQRARE